MATFTVNHILANDPNKIGQPIAYVVDERYSENIILTVSNIKGYDANNISYIKVYDDGIYLGEMSSGAFWGQNQNYSLSIKSTDLSFDTEYNQLSFIAYDNAGNILGEEFTTIKTVEIPDTIYKVSEVNYSYNDVEIIGELDVFELLMPQINSKFSFGKEKIRLADFFNIFSTGLVLKTDQTVVYDGFSFQQECNSTLKLMCFGNEIYTSEKKDESFGTANYTIEDIPAPGFLNGSSLTFGYSFPSNVSIAISNDFNNQTEKDDTSFKKTIPTGIPFVNITVSAEANLGSWELKGEWNAIPGSEEREWAASFTINAGIEIKAGGALGIGADSYSASLVEAGVYGSGDVTGTLSYSTTKSWSGELGISISGGLFLDALTLKVGNFDVKMYSVKYEFLSYDASINFSNGSTKESARDHASPISKAAVNFFMKDGINCKQRGNVFTFTANLEADKMLYVFDAMQKSNNLNYNVVLRYAEVKDDGTFGERQEVFVNEFNALTCAALQTTLTLDENKNYAYSFVLIPESQKENNLDFVSSSDIFYTKPTLTVEKITVKEPTDAPYMTTVEKAEFTVKLSNAVDYDIKLAWFTCTGGTATEEVDYQAAENSSDRTLVIKAGETEATFSISVLGDSEDESDENFYIKMYAYGDSADKVVFSSENLMADYDTNWGYSECIIKDSNTKGAAAVTVIDVSGSMQGVKLAEAKSSANSFIRGMQAGDYIGVVSFESSAYIEYSLTQITGESVKNEAISAVNSLYAGGGTYIGSGIAAAAGMLNNVDATSKTIIAMTDGEDGYPSSTRNIVLGLLDSGITIHGIELATRSDYSLRNSVQTDDSYSITATDESSNKSLMEEIAELTGGKYYYAATEKDLEDIYFELSTRTSNQQFITNSSSTVEADDFIINSVIVDSSCTSVRLGINWDNDDLNLILWDPNGNYYDSTVNSDLVKYVSGQNSEYYEITAPTKGVWGLGVIGQGETDDIIEYDYYAVAVSSITADLEFDIPHAAAGQMVAINCTVNNNSTPVTEASVYANVISPDDEYFTIDLYDDGLHGDKLANDGIYGNFIQQNTPGFYKVTGIVEGSATMGDVFYRQTVEEQLQIDSGILVPEITLERIASGSGRTAILTASTDDGSPLYYNTSSYDYSGEWTLYTGPMRVKKDTTYFFKATNAAGNTNKNSITIDISPKIFYIPGKDNDMAIYSNKLTRATTVDKNSLFSAKADITTSNDDFFALFSYGEAQHLILNNNISISNTRVLDGSYEDTYTLTAAVYFAWDSQNNSQIDFNFVTGNNKAKKIKSTYTASTFKDLEAIGFVALEGLYISGQKFLYSFDVKSENTGSGNASAYGMSFYSIYANADITKNINVSAAANGRYATATASALSTGGDIYLQRGISGNISVTAQSKYSNSTATAFETSDLDVEGKITGKITVNATGNTNNEQVLAYGFRADFIFLTNFDGKMTVSAQNSGTTYAYGIKAEAENENELSILSGTKGQITVTASSTDGDANAYGIRSFDTITIANYSNAITVSATSKNNEAWSAAIYANNAISIFCDIDKKISVSAKNTRATAAYDTNAWGLYSSQSYISMQDIKADIAITSQNEGNASAIAFQAATGIKTGDITSKITAVANNKEHYGAGSASAAAFDCGTGTFTAEVISGKFTITATDSDATANGIEAGGDISIDDMAKSSLSINAKSKNGDASAAAIMAGGNFNLDSDGLNLGKISVNAQSGRGYEAVACGLQVTGAITTAFNIGQTLSGDVVVKSNGISVGIWADSIDVSTSVNLQVSGTDSAYGYVLGTADKSILNISGATVKTGVTDKFNKDNAYAVYALTGNANQTVFISDTSVVHGNIDLAGGTDTVCIESGSKLKGALSNVENIILNVADVSAKNKSLWDITDSFMNQANLEIDFDYGMTGDFLVCTKESSVRWSDALANGIDVSFNEGLNVYNDMFKISNRDNYYSDGFYEFELKLDGNKMILSVTEKMG